MSLRFLLTLALLGACAQDHSGAPGDSCELALSMLDEALTGARADGEPACSDSADCVILQTSVSCDNILDIRLCGQIVHREVRDRYLAAQVDERICRAVRGAEYGCNVIPLCAGTVPTCSAGRCVAASP